MRHFFRSLLLLCTFSALFVDGRRRGSKKNRIIPGPTESTTTDAVDRGLTSTTLSAKVLAEEHNRYFEDLDRKSFNGDALAYVTPWNGLGYDMAKAYRSKFSYISPVWLQIRRDVSNTMVITGTHDIDKSWMRDLRDGCTEGGHCPRIVPRVILETSPPRAGETVELADQIVSLCRENAFDGVVLEGGAEPALRPLISRLGARFRSTPSGWCDRVDSETREDAATSDCSLHLVLVLPPLGRGRRVGIAALKDLAKDATKFSVMTYDFSGGSGGPNAPIQWVQQTAEALMGEEPWDASLASKVMLGMPFYGYDMERAVVGHEVVSLIAKTRPVLRWDEQAKEHFFVYRSATNAKRRVYFPTPASIAVRLRLAESLGMGVSIWEIGQGMQSYYDVL